MQCFEHEAVPSHTKAHQGQASQELAMPGYLSTSRYSSSNEQTFQTGTLQLVQHSAQPSAQAGSMLGPVIQKMSNRSAIRVIGSVSVCASRQCSKMTSKLKLCTTVLATASARRVRIAASSSDRASLVAGT